MSAGFSFDGDEGFYSAIGKLTISWAYVEFGLDWLIREIHEPLDGHKHIEPDAPVSAALPNGQDKFRRTQRWRVTVGGFAEV